MKDDLVADVKDRLSVDEVVADYVELKRSGRNFKGLSPFTSEKTPSFMVSPEKQIWHDFSSGKGGDMLSFIMEVEGVDFKTALDQLARKAGLDPADYRSGGSSGMDKRRKIAKEALDVATKFYQAQLVANKPALAYATKKRGFNKDIISDFRIGYAPDTWESLYTYLAQKDFTEQAIEDAGLAVKSKRGKIDMFRGRLMIPLMDASGSVIGFTARLIDDQPDSPKYINTPQTIVYDKSRHVFGYSQAKDAIRRSGYVVITEGNLDVVSSHKMGVRQVVATAGTAMTMHHLKLVSRLTNDVRLAFDADDAGIKATERTIELAQEMDVRLSIVSLPDGEDPDDLVRRDLAKWQEVIDSPQYALDWLYQRHKERVDITTAKGKREFSDIVLSTIRVLKDDVEKDHYIVQLSKDLDVSKQALLSKMNGAGADGKSKRLKKPKANQHSGEYDNTAVEDSFLGLLMLYPITRRLSLDTDQPLEFVRPGRQDIYQYIRDNPQASIDDTSLPAELRDHVEYVKLILFTAEEQYKKLDSNERLREASDLANKIIETNKKNRLKLLTQSIEEAESSGDAAKVQELLKQVDVIIKSQKDS